jgi:anti-sigma regulatory factor (Ser/Thr protein kinase)
MRYLKYKDEMYRSLIFNISDKAPFNAILKCINLVDSGISHELEEHIYYSTMELVNNSLRAHREKGISSRPVRVKVSAEEEFLVIEILDYGGGFNRDDLPYDYQLPPEKVNTDDFSFQRYREKYEYRRFGMGILTARQTADDFSLQFHRKGEKSEVYREGETEGTIVTMGIKWNE